MKNSVEYTYKLLEYKYILPLKEKYKNERTRRECNKSLLLRANRQRERDKNREGGGNEIKKERKVKKKHIQKQHHTTISPNLHTKERIVNTFERHDPRALIKMFSSLHFLPEFWPRRSS